VRRQLVVRAAAQQGPQHRVGVVAVSAPGGAGQQLVEAAGAGQYRIVRPAVQWLPGGATCDEDAPVVVEVEEELEAHRNTLLSNRGVDDATRHSRDHSRIAPR
jgi:hypothetical protein